MDLDSLRIVVALHECGSAQAAAKQLPYSRATIRRRLDAIEASLGVRLFHRTTTGFLPTEAGLVLARRGREMLAQADALADTVRQVGGTPRGRVRLALPAGVPPSAVVDFWRATSQLLPNVRFETRIGAHSPERLFDSADLAVTFGEPPEPRSFDALPIGAAYIHLLATAEYLAGHPRIETPAQLRAHPLFVWARPSEASPARIPRIDGPDLPIEPAFVSDDIFALRCLAADGAGIAWAPDGYFEPREGTPLVRILADTFCERVPMWLVVARANADAPAVRAVLDVARGVVALGGAESA